MTNPITTFCSVAALAMMAVSASAQQRPQDFTLPPNPTPTATPQGPADERAGVPIAPRAIPAATPSPFPSPTPTPTPAPGTQPTAAPTAAATPPARVPAQPTASPTPSATTRPGLTNVPPAANDSEAVGALAQGPEAQADSDPVPNSLPLPLPQVATPAAGEEPAPLLPDWWPWASGLLGALLAGGLGGWLIARRRAARPAPRIEPPIAGLKPREPGPTADLPPPDITLEIESLTRSMMMLSLAYRVTLLNRSGHALLDIAISADLISSSRALPVDQQLATAATRLEPVASIERIGPHQSASVTGRLQLPLSALDIYRQGQLPFCVPLLRLRLEGQPFDPELRTFVIGIDATGPGGRVHPLPLAGPPGGYDNARARAVGSLAP